MASCAWKTGSTPISRTCGRRSLIPAAWAGGWARWTATSAWAESSAFIFSPVDRKAPRRLLVTLRDASPQPGQPEEEGIEVTLADDGGQSLLAWETRGMSTDLL